MILRKDSLDAIERGEFDTLLDMNSSVVRRGKEDNGLEFSMHKFPAVDSQNSMIAIHYAYVLYSEGRPCFVSQIESVNLRLLASASSVSVKEIQRQYDTKSFYTPPRIFLYSHSLREDLGVYQGRGNDEEVFALLKNLADESFITEDDGDYSQWMFSEDDE